MNKVASSLRAIDNYIGMQKQAEISVATEIVLNKIASGHDLVTALNDVCAGDGIRKQAIFNRISKGFKNVANMVSGASNMVDDFIKKVKLYQAKKYQSQVQAQAKKYQSRANLKKALNTPFKKPTVSLGSLSGVNYVSPGTIISGRGVRNTPAGSVIAKDNRVKTSIAQQMRQNNYHNNYLLPMQNGLPV